MHTKLYKKDSKGKMRYWYAYASQGFVTSCSGIVGREESSEVGEQYEAQPKNIGKKNETTREQQAEIEVEALYRVKLDKKRYFLDIVVAGGYVSRDVQLVHDYTKKKNASKIQWGKVDGQVKLDGVRCRITLNRKSGWLRAYSRENKLYALPPTLFKELLKLFEDNPHLDSLDGELYIHEMDMADIVSLVTDVNEPDRDQLQFWMYDVIESDLTWEQRKAILEKVNFDGYKKIVHVAWKTLNSEAEARDFLDVAVSDLFEGIILRNWKGKYLCGRRSYDVQKWKLFQDAEFNLVRVVLDKRGHGVGVFVTKDFKEFNARWKAPNAKRQHLADHPEEYVNLMWTIRFQKYSLDNIPIFPVAICPRDYEA